MTCAPCTHGVSTRAKKKTAAEPAAGHRKCTNTFELCSRRLGKCIIVNSSDWRRHERWRFSGTSDAAETHFGGRREGHRSSYRSIKHTCFHRPFSWRPQFLCSLASPCPRPALPFQNRGHKLTENPFYLGQASHNLRLHLFRKHKHFSKPTCTAEALWSSNHFVKAKHVYCNNKTLPYVFKSHL